MSETQQASDAPNPPADLAPESQAAAPPESPVQVGEESSADVSGDVAQPATAPPPPLSDDERATLALKVEAALLTTDRPVAASKLAEALSVSAKDVNEAVEQLNQFYEESGRSFRIEKVASGWQVHTLAEHADVLASLHKTRSQSKLSAAALETLAIIAYKQPILRAELENIRGVASGEVLRSLMERHLVKIVGRAEELGRPMLYGTTKTFLEVFGLSSLKDLPKVEELRPKEG